MGAVEGRARGMVGRLGSSPTSWKWVPSLGPWWSQHRGQGSSRRQAPPSATFSPKPMEHKVTGDIILAGRPHCIRGWHRGKTSYSHSPQKSLPAACPLREEVWAGLGPRSVRLREDVANLQGYPTWALTWPPTHMQCLQEKQQSVMQHDNW